jgi:hypothetical protein
MISRRQRREVRAKHSRAALSIREVVAAAARAGRQHTWRVLAAAVAVSVATALMEIAVDDLVDRTNLPLALLTGFSSSSVSILGEVFLSGFLCRLVSETEHRAKDTSVRHVARTLPWGRLIRADLLVVMLVVVGTIALIIPGLVVFNLLAVVGPVVEIENRPVLSALRRSSHLVRQHFWTVALLVTLPVILAGGLESAVPHPDSAGTILAALAIRGLGEAAVQAVIGLVLVELCYRLIALDRKPAAPAALSESPPA